MVSPIINEQFYDGGFIVREAEGFRSRDAGYMDNSTGADILYEAGLVVVQAAAGVVASSHPANVGNGTIGSLSTGPLSELGIYVLTAISATQFNVVAPSGDSIGTATVGTAFAGQVNFAITAGGTAFAAGDIFDLTVSEQSGGWVSWTGGSITTPIAILWGRSWVQAGNFKKVTLISRDCEVNQAELQWDPAVSGSGSFATLVQTALAALKTSGIVAR
jgi:hypothetical protein